MRLLAVTILVFIITLTVFGQKQNLRLKNSGYKKTAPSFSVKDINGKKINSEKLKGKIIVLNFWYMDCPPCLKEIPHLNKLVERFKEKDVVFIAFTEDKSKELKGFLKNHVFEYRIVPESLSVIAQYGTKIGGESLMLYPTHILINRDGKIESRVSGMEGIKTMEKGIKNLLDVKPTK